MLACPCWLQAWTYNNRAAIVIGVTDPQSQTAVRDRIKLQRLVELLRRLVEKAGDNVAVSVEQVCVSLFVHMRVLTSGVRES